MMKFSASALLGLACLLSLSGCQWGGSGSDLVINSAKLSVLDAKVGTIALDMVIENKGIGNAGKEFALTGNWKEQPSSSVSFRLSVPGGLEAGKQKHLTEQLDLPALIGKSGTYEFSVDKCPQAFCNNQIEESNEDNNTLTVPFTL